MSRPWPLRIVLAAAAVLVAIGAAATVPPPVKKTAAATKLPYSESAITVSSSRARMSGMSNGRISQLCRARNCNRYPTQIGISEGLKTTSF